MDKAKFLVENNVLTAEFYDMTEQEFSATTENPFGQIPYRREKITGEVPSNPHPVVLNAWVEAILHRGELIADGREGLQGTMLANAIQLSTFLGHEVALPPDDEQYYEELMKRVATSRRKTTVKTVIADTANSFAGTH